MQAGQLRHRVTIQRVDVSTSAGAYNEVVPSVVVVETVWATVKPIQMNERVFAQQVDATATHVVTMRYNASLVGHPEYQLAYEGRTLRITGIVPDERKTMLTVACTEVV